MQNNPLLQYGEMLAGFRKDLYLTQEEVALHCGVSTLTISHWERGRRIPNSENRRMLNNLYQIPPEGGLLGMLKMYSKEELAQLVITLLDKGNR